MQLGTVAHLTALYRLLGQHDSPLRTTAAAFPNPLKTQIEPSRSCCRGTALHVDVYG